MDAAEGALLDRNIAKERIHIERFTADRPAEAVAREMAELQTKAEGVTVSVTLDGRTRKVAFTAGNILDSARASGLPAPFACKAGVCATCRAKVTSGNQWRHGFLSWTNGTQKTSERDVVDVKSRLFRQWPVLSPTRHATID